MKGRATRELEAADNVAQAFRGKEPAMESSEAKAQAQELGQKIEALKREFADVAKTAKDRAVRGTTDWVKDNPFAAIGIAAAVGLAVGLLIGRKTS